MVQLDLFRWADDQARKKDENFNEVKLGDDAPAVVSISPANPPVREGHKT